MTPEIKKHPKGTATPTVVRCKPGRVVALSCGFRPRQDGRAPTFNRLESELAALAGNDPSASAGRRFRSMKELPT